MIVEVFGQYVFTDNILRVDGYNTFKYIPNKDHLYEVFGMLSKKIKDASSIIKERGKLLFQANQVYQSQWGRNHKLEKRISSNQHLLDNIESLYGELYDAFNEKRRFPYVERDVLVYDLREVSDLYDWLKEHNVHKKTNELLPVLRNIEGILFDLGKKVEKDMDEIIKKNEEQRGSKIIFVNGDELFFVESKEAVSAEINKKLRGE